MVMALVGHISAQQKQEMHCFRSTTGQGLSLMAWAEHTSAQRPHFVHNPRFSTGSRRNRGNSTATDMVRMSVMPVAGSRKPEHRNAVRFGAGHHRHHRVERHTVPGREEFPDVQHSAAAWTLLAVHSAQRVHDMQHRDRNRLVDIDQQFGEAGCGRGLAMQG
jgi:hypothetical protein